MNKPIYGIPIGVGGGAKFDEFHNLTSTNEFDENKLPTDIYYKVLEPEWVNTVVVKDESAPYEVSSIEYTEEEIEIPFRSINNYSNTITVPAKSYYHSNEDSYKYLEGETPDISPLQEYTYYNEKTMCDDKGKIIYVHTYSKMGGYDDTEAIIYVTLFRYEDGSPVEAPLTLYPAEIKSFYDFENLQFTDKGTDEKGANTKLGDVYSYVDEWGNRCYTLYPDYTPNIAEGQRAISLAVSDPEKMDYSIRLEALFNGGYKYSLGNKEFSFLGGKDVVADGNGAFASGRESIVLGSGAQSFGSLNKIRTQSGTALGYNNIVTGRHGVALNEGNKVLGYAAAGFGDHNITHGYYDIIGGWQNKSKGYANFGQGAKNILDGKFILGLGSYNTIKGQYDNAQGYKNEVDGNYNDLNGYLNTIIGNSNIVRGTLNKVNSSNNKVFGSENSIVNTSDFNIINGQKNQINASDSVDNFISGVGNIVEPSPYEKQKNYGYCTLLGRYNISKSSYGIAIGTNLIVDGGYGSQLVLGKYNKVDRYANIIIGNGSSDTQRNNIFVVKNDGRAVLGADPKENMDAVTKQYLDNKVKEIVDKLSTAITKILEEQNGIISIQNELIVNGEIHEILDEILTTQESYIGGET